MDDTSFKPIAGNTFKFNCHKEIKCFTKCCADLKLVLTPYDILRLKNRLGMSSDEFLNLYADTTLDQHSRFPKMILKMNEDGKRKCPFVTQDGCGIYEDRPGACRVYPVGRASMKVVKEKNAREKFFLIQEPHCLGFQEDKEWEIDEWMNSEGLDEYNAMNDLWLEIITSKKDLGPENVFIRKIQMFSMASYNLDKFRNFLLESRFFDLFDIEPEFREKLASDDKELIKFAMDWLKFSLFGEKTINIKA